MILDKNCSLPYYLLFTENQVAKSINRLKNLISYHFNFKHFNKAAKLLKGSR